MQLLIRCSYMDIMLFNLDIFQYVNFVIFGQVTFNFSHQFIWQEPLLN